MKIKRIITVLLIAIVLVGQVGIFSHSDAAAKPAPVKNFKAYAGYKCVALEWTAVKGAKSYKVYRNGKLVKAKVTNAFAKKNTKACIVKTGKEGVTSDKYFVRAYAADGKTYSQSRTTEKKSTGQLLISARFNQDKTLYCKCHDSGHRFHYGDKIKAHSFKFGKYIFKYNGHTFHANYSRLRNFNANLCTTYTYSGREAEYFARTSGIDSSTNYLIWANLYTQRLYVFKGSKGNWRLFLNLKNNGVNKCSWDISSGKPTSPSPAGKYFDIYKRRYIKPSNGVKYWNYYHSQTSLHGKVGSQPFDRPRSEGCIRNPDKYAQLLYYKLPMHTRVVVY